MDRRERGVMLLFDITSAINRDFIFARPLKEHIKNLIAKMLLIQESISRIKVPVLKTPV